PDGLLVGLGEVGRCGEAMLNCSLTVDARTESFRQPVEQDYAQVERHLLAGDRIDEGFEDTGEARWSDPGELLDKGPEKLVVVGKDVERLQIHREPEDLRYEQLGLFSYLVVGRRVQADDEHRLGAGGFLDDR